MIDDERDFPGRDDLLSAARRDFPAFYMSCAPEDALLFDGLVMAYAALTVGLNQPRAFVAVPVRDALERVTQRERR